MSKDKSTKTDALREARERQWQEAQKKPSKSKGPSAEEQDWLEDKARGRLDDPIPEPPKRTRIEKAPKKPALGGKTGSIGSSAPDEARCSVCSKLVSLRNGKVTHHQRGFGKACPGAGKEPKS